jgi:ubiquinone biosynthesis monooxygenase Coq7
MTLTPNRREEMLRVDHAGEYGAVAIYRGQLAVLNVSRAASGRTAEEMAGQSRSIWTLSTSC